MTSHGRRGFYSKDLSMAVLLLESSYLSIFFSVVHLGFRNFFFCCGSFIKHQTSLNKTLKIYPLTNSDYAQLDAYLRKLT